MSHDSCDVKRRCLMPWLLRMLLVTFILFGDIIDALLHRGLISKSGCVYDFDVSGSVDTC